MYTIRIPIAIPILVNTLNSPLMLGIAISIEYTVAGVLDKPIVNPIINLLAISCQKKRSKFVVLEKAIKLHEIIAKILIKIKVLFLPIPSSVYANKNPPKGAAIAFIEAET